MQAISVLVGLHVNACKCMLDQIPYFDSLRDYISIHGISSDMHESHLVLILHGHACICMPFLTLPVDCSLNYESIDSKLDMHA